MTPNISITGKVWLIMICVVEYGEDIGTLRNLFSSKQQAIAFAKRIMALSDKKYRRIGLHQWYCREKREYVKIEGLEK
jgi:hypothetical protein